MRVMDLLNWDLFFTGKWISYDNARYIERYPSRIPFRKSIRTVNLHIERSLPTKITFEHDALWMSKIKFILIRGICRNNNFLLLQLKQNDCIYLLLTFQVASLIFQTANLFIICHIILYCISFYYHYIRWYFVLPKKERLMNVKFSISCDL
jgi:hypothetical protein